MEKRIKDWLLNFSSQSVQIWCEDPETSVEKVAGGVIDKTFLTYRVLMKQVGRDIIGVRHRYSEFEGLQKSLKERYAALGIIVPSLPPKTSVSSIIGQRFDDSFVKERTLGLTLFCENIVASPFLRNDAEWKEFMKPPSNQITSFSTHSSSSSKYEGISGKDGGNAGEEYLFAALQSIDLPYNKYTLLEWMDSILQELLLIEKQVKSILIKVRVWQNNHKSFLSSQTQLLHALGNWETSEKQHIRYLSGKHHSLIAPVIQNPHEEMTESLNATSSLLATQYSTEKDLPIHEGLSLSVLLEQELAMIEALRELLHLHSELCTSMESAFTKLTKTQQSKPFANKFETIAEQQQTFADRENCLRLFYKGFIFFTIPSCAQRRAAAARRLTASLASSHITASFAVQKACLEYFKSLRMRPTTAVAETSHLLDLLDCRQLQQLPEEAVIRFDLKGDEEAVGEAGESPEDETKGPISSTDDDLALAGIASTFSLLFDRALTLKIDDNGTPVAPTAVLHSNGSESPAPHSNVIQRDGVPAEQQTGYNPVIGPANVGTTNSGGVSSITSLPPPPKLVVKEEPVDMQYQKLVGGSPVRVNEKTRSLLDDLMGGGSPEADGGKKDVWG